LNDNKKRGMSGVPFIIFVVLVLGILWYMGRVQQQGQEITYAVFEEAIEDNLVDEVYISQNKTAPTGVVAISMKESGDVKRVYVSDVNEVQDFLKENKYPYRLGNIKEDSWVMTAVLPALIVVVGIFLLFMLMNRQGGGNAKAMNFGKSRARMSGPEDKKVTFADVAGLKEEKEELEEIVDFLKAPKKYIQVGARIPKGVLLEMR
jgi:cell division protease FtsH